MTDLDFDHFRQLVRQRSGLALTPDKAYLVLSRLAPIARTEGLADVSALLTRLRLGAPEALLRRCVDAMATHESFFFRDGTPFNLLADRVLPELIEARRAHRSLRIWCAACSSGQEPYSVAMLLQEAGGALAGWRTEIVATDMSESILEKARSGLYTDFEVHRGLSEARLNRWFTREGAAWQVSSTLKQMVSFRPHNLLDGTAGLGTFDILFCRNVLIYFDVPQKRTIFADLAAVMADRGALFLGSAETVIGITDAFELTPGAPGLYRPSTVPARVAKIA